MKHRPARFEPGPDFEEFAEAAVFTSLLLNPIDESWFQPILGEAGAGKSRLLREWATRFAREGTRSFAVVPLRRLTKADAGLFGELLAQRLSVIAAETARSSGLPSSTASAKGAQCVWFLDGLDEVPDDVWWGGLGDALTALPGSKIATCRSAVFPSRRATLGDGVLTRWREDLVVMPLNQEEQGAFLRTRLPNGEASKVADHINASDALRELAAFPLLLTLMIDLDLPLPVGRSSFYDRVEAALGSRQARSPNHDHLWASCRAVLDSIAATIPLDNVEAPLSNLVAACTGEQFEILTASGLIVVHRVRNSFSFLHMSFQEYHFARSLRADGLAKALETLWPNIRAEEPLALLVAMEAQDEMGLRSVAAVLETFIRVGLGLYLDAPKVIVDTGRSPTRTAFHILARSGIDDPLWSQMTAIRRFTTTSGIGFALAGDLRAPPAVLTFLASDKNAGVRSRLAGNPSTPLAALRKLAVDPDHIVRGCVAENPSISGDMLDGLTRDCDEHVRLAAGNRLAWRELDARFDKAGRAAFNDAEKLASAAVSLTPEMVLALDDEDRRALIEDKSTPHAILELLARDPDPYLRASLAHSTSTPAKILDQLARDADSMVRVGVAMNTAAPLPALYRLTHDPNRQARRFSTMNPSAALEGAAISDIPNWIFWPRRLALLVAAMRLMIGRSKRKKAESPNRPGLVVSGVREGFLRAAGALLFSFVSLAVFVAAVSLWIAITDGNGAHGPKSLGEIYQQARRAVEKMHPH